MAPRHPCYRHRSAWIAGCADCTAWHKATLADQRATAEERTTPATGDSVASGTAAEKRVAATAAA